MFGAIRHVHWQKGPWNTEGGYELPLVILSTLAALTEAGPGPLSLDRRLGIERHGDLLALATGAAGSAVASELARRLPRPVAEPQPAQERQAVFTQA
jgi:putative oxidoreductase